MHTRPDMSNMGHTVVLAGLHEFMRSSVSWGTTWWTVWFMGRVHWPGLVYSVYPRYGGCGGCSGDGAQSG